MTKGPFEGFTARRGGPVLNRGGSDRDANLTNQIRRSRQSGGEVDVRGLHPVVQEIFKKEDRTLKKYGVSSKQSKAWTSSLARGQTPSGFEDLRHFEVSVLETLAEHYLPNPRTHSSLGFRATMALRRTRSGGEGE